jgi:hypothetical protein
MQQSYNKSKVVTTNALTMIQFFWKLKHSLEGIHARASLNNSHNETNAMKLKLYFIHTISGSVELVSSTRLQTNCTICFIDSNTLKIIKTD